MEIQHIVSGFSPKLSSSAPSIPIGKQLFSLKFPSLFSSSSYPSIQSQNFEVPSISIGKKDEFYSSRRRRVRCSSSSSNTVADRNKGNEVARRKKLAVFVSGGGSNFKSIHEASKRGSLHGDVVVLVTNKTECGGAEYARSHSIPVIVFPKPKAESDGLSPHDLVATLRRFEVDFILLAGYLKLIPAELIRAYERSIFNIHPSLLPAFGGKGCYGMKVHKAVIASGARFSGPTIHFVDEHYDTGRILAQRVVPVLANDTAEELAARVLREEHQLYVEVAEALCEDRIVWRKDGVPLIQSKENPNETY
ncbi:phosphoribosylglycinamide formyltransferase, chloroplastic-like [Trifolium pratense]|uniref:phosphoribosylglycinamide formyltransferase, chloroplastic-like n=1 Tax=Trifolium pratense TaxID=57577 RepID=UPI001E6918BA|nr:phosphoribosylglycinamide formyltransferase, chloroplastic-like [Trifolium pratense]